MSHKLFKCYFLFLHRRFRDLHGVFDVVVGLAPSGDRVDPRQPHGIDRLVDGVDKDTHVFDGNLMLLLFLRGRFVLFRQDLGD